MLEMPLMMTPLRPAMARKASERPALLQVTAASLMSLSKADAIRKIGTAPTTTRATTVSPEARTCFPPSNRVRRAWSGVSRITNRKAMTMSPKKGKST